MGTSGTAAPTSPSTHRKRVPHHPSSTTFALRRAESTLPKSSSQRTQGTVDRGVSPERPICYGRVADLSTMIPAQWWQSVFSDDLYLKTDGDVVEDPEITRAEIELLEMDPMIRQVLVRRDGARVLDLCCGQGRHSLQLALDYPQLSLHGHDQSAYLIGLAKERSIALMPSFQCLGRESMPEFSVGDCRHIPYENEYFDLVMVMGNSFGYFGVDDDDKSVLREIARVMAPGAVLVLDLTNGSYMRENYSPRSWEWIDDNTFVCRERSLSSDKQRLASREVITDVRRGVLRDQFYQERLYSEDQVLEMLSDVGLHRGMVLQGEVATGKELSKRQQDLGMMEYRMLIAASKATSSSLPLPNVLSRLKQQQSSRKMSVTDSGVASDDLLTRAAPRSTGSSTDDLQRDGASLTPPTTSSWSPVDELTPLQLENVPAGTCVILGDPSQPCRGKLNDQWNPEDVATQQRLQDAIASLDVQDIIYLSCHDQLLRHLLDNRPPFVFNLCDEGFANIAEQELHVPAMLEMLKIPYSGAGPQCLALCYDKQLTNAVAAAIGVSVPLERSILGRESIERLLDSRSPEYRLVHHHLQYPVFVKPVRGDNSLGITVKSICYDAKTLVELTQTLLSEGHQDLLIQEYLTGAEYSVGVLGNPGITLPKSLLMPSVPPAANVPQGFYFLPTLRVNYDRIVQQGLPPLLGFESKWDPTSPYWCDVSYERADPEHACTTTSSACNKNSIVTTLTISQQADMHDAAARLFTRLGCRDYARFDFRVDARGKVKLLEVNPNPGWCWDGKLAKMASYAGWQYARLLKEIVQVSAFRCFGVPEERLDATESLNVATTSNDLHQQSPPSTTATR